MRNTVQHSYCGLKVFDNRDDAKINIFFLISPQEDILWVLIRSASGRNQKTKNHYENTPIQTNLKILQPKTGKFPDKKF